MCTYYENMQGYTLTIGTGQAGIDGILVGDTQPGNNSTIQVGYSSNATRQRALKALLAPDDYSNEKASIIELQAGGIPKSEYTITNITDDTSNQRFILSVTNDIAGGNFTTGTTVTNLKFQRDGKANDNNWYVYLNNSSNTVIVDNLNNPSSTSIDVYWDLNSTYQSNASTGNNIIVVSKPRTGTMTYNYTWYNNGSLNGIGLGGITNGEPYILKFMYWEFTADNDYGLMVLGNRGYA